MSSISNEIYDLLRTYQRELNQREPVERKGAAKESGPAFSKVLEEVTGAQAPAASAPVASPQAPASTEQDQPSETMLKQLNYDPAGYLKANTRERQSIIDFFQ